jgi:hypothetical protein
MIKFSLLIRQIFCRHQFNFKEKYNIPLRSRSKRYPLLATVIERQCPKCGYCDVVYKKNPDKHKILDS